jgi:MFS family permease
MSLSAAPAVSGHNVVLRIAPFVFIIFTIYLTVGMPLAALPLHVHDQLGFDNLTVGITIGVQSLVTLLTRQFAGSLSDRRGPKFAVALGGLVSLIAGAIYLASTLPSLVPQASLGILFIGRAGLGVAESLVMTGTLAWAIATVGPQHTGKVMVWVGIAMYGAVAAGAPFGIYLMAHSSTGGGFAAVSWATLLFATMVLATAVFVPAVRPHHGERLPFLKVAVQIAPFGSGLALATISFGAIAAFAALDFQRMGWSGSGFALTGFGAAYILTRVLFGGWPDRFGGARVAFWSLLIETAGQALLWIAFDPALAFAGAILTGVGFSLVFPSFGIEAVKPIPAASRGAALGAYVAFFDVGFAIAGPLTGLIAGTFGYPSVFAAGAVAAVAGLLVARRRRMS